MTLIEPAGPEPAGLPPDGHLSLRRSRRVQAWVLAEFGSAFGDQFLIVAVAATAAVRYGALATGLVLAAGALPRALLALPGGLLADRLGARRVMALADLSRAAILVLAVVVTQLIGTGIAVLVAVAAVTGMFAAVFEPASLAIAPLLVGPGQLVALNSLRVGVARAAVLIGAPVAGVVVLGRGAGFAFAVDAATFAASAAALTLLRPVRPAQAPSSSGRLGAGRQLRAGLRYAASHPLLRAALVTIGLIEFTLTGAVNTGLPLLASEREWGPQGLGLLLGGFGAGSIVGPALAPVLARSRQPLGIGLLAAALGTAGFAVTGEVRSVASAVAVVAVLGAAVSMLAAQLLPVVQRACEPEYLGRIGGLTTLALAGAAPISILAAGALGAWVGAPSAILASGALACAVCMGALLSPQLRGSASAGRLVLPAPAGPVDSSRNITQTTCSNCPDVGCCSDGWGCDLLNGGVTMSELSQDEELLPTGPDSEIADNTNVFC